MQDEMTSIEQNQVWELVKAPAGKSVIANRWIFKIKKDANGNVQRYKVRLVAKGYNQEEGIDYTETFSPVVRFDSIRLILAMAAKENLVLQQFDVKTAFLNGTIEEDIYMKQPEGFSDGTGRVCKLQKSLYCLKRSSRCWNLRFTQFLNKFGLKSTSADPCIFVSQKEGKRLILAIHIDDGLIAAESKEVSEEFISEMKKEFEITITEVGMYLGLKFVKRKRMDFSYIKRLTHQK